MIKTICWFSPQSWLNQIKMKTFKVWIFLCLFHLNRSDQNILQLVSKGHIMQARCRLQCSRPFSTKCWQDCSKAKDKGHIIKETPINIKLAFKGCNMLEWDGIPNSIYQIYSQDQNNAWHNEGQTDQTRLKIRPDTKAVKVIMVSALKIYTAKARKPVNCLNAENLMPLRQWPLKQQEEEEATVKAKASSYVSIIALGAVVCAIFGVLLGAGVAVLCMMKGPPHCLISRKSWMTPWHFTVNQRNKRN